jgi:hypothetical protein
VDAEIREKIVAAFHKLVQEAGAPTFEEGMTQAETLTASLGSWILFVNGVIKQIRTTEDLRRMIDCQVLFSEHDQALLLAVLASLPQILRFVMAAIAEKAASDLPPPPSGRKRTFTPQQAHGVLDYISQLNRTGVRMKTAKGRAAQKFGCSPRTVERLWASRESVPSEDPPTIQELISMVLRAGEADGWKAPVH